MTKSNRTAPSRRASSRETASKKKRGRRWRLAAGLAGLTVALLLVLKGSFFMVDSGGGLTATSTEKADWSPLVGDWIRPDGGYVIRVTRVDADGRVDAGYFNPRPISVARAVALFERGKVGLFMELRDAGYPGSTYTLSYNAKADALAGAYYQAAMGQSFEVAFIRKR